MSNGGTTATTVRGRIGRAVVLALSLCAALGIALPVFAQDEDAPQPEATVEQSCPAPALNANPYCFNLRSGARITSPPAEFCTYFDCIPNFWNGRGYVVQCRDGLFSKSGGIQGSCSRHGGNGAALLGP